MQMGRRLLYDAQTGKVLNGTLGEMRGDIQEGLRPQEIDYRDLPYGYSDNHFRDAESYHIDGSKPKTASVADRIVIDKYIQREITGTGRIKEREDPLLIQEEAKTGGVL